MKRWNLGCVFTPDEASKIIEESNHRTEQHSAFDHASGHKYRDSHVYWIPLVAETRWVFDRLKQAVDVCDHGIQIENCNSLQLTRYTAGQQYGWHIDSGPGPQSRRKISVVVALNESTCYQGGGLELDRFVDLNVGEGVAFRSDTMHRALEVTGGERWSLVTWYCSPKLVD